MRKLLAAWCGSLLLLSSSVASAAGIQGDYVEARTADVFTGPCFSNAEVFIYGNQAVMAWKVNQGSWKGTDLSGLCVAAAVRGTTTFSEDSPRRPTTVLIVDAEGRRPPSARRWWRWPGARRQPAEEDRGRQDGPDEPEARRPSDVGGRRGPGPAHGMPHAPRASFWAAGPGPDRDPSARRERPLLRQRGRRLRAPLAGRQGPAGLHPRPRVQGRGARHPLERPELPQQLRRPFRLLMAMRTSIRSSPGDLPGARRLYRGFVGRACDGRAFRVHERPGELEARTHAIAPILVAFLLCFVRGPSLAQDSYKVEALKQAPPSSRRAGDRRGLEARATGSSTTRVSRSRRSGCARRCPRRQSPRAPRG